MSYMKRAIVTALCAALSAPVCANLSGTYKTVAVDGKLTEWSNPGDILYNTSEVAAGIPGNSSYETVYVANDVENLYIGLDMMGAGGGHITNSWTCNIYMDTDMNTSTGFNAGWMSHGYDRLIQYGAGGTSYSVHSFSGSTQSEWAWNYLGPVTPYSFIDDVIELSIPLHWLGLSGDSVVMEFNVTGTGITTETWASKSEAEAETYTLAVLKSAAHNTEK